MSDQQPADRPDIRLHAAAAKGDLNRLKELLQAGSDIDAPDENGSTPLFAAAFKGQIAAVEFLIQRGAKIDQGNVVGYTPLMTAGREKHPAVVEALLKAKADPEIAAQSGMKAIHWALLDTRPEGKYMHCETESRLIEILKTFKRFGPNLQTKDSRGTTALMDAAWWALADTVQFLLDGGANHEETDNEGKKALDYAKQKLAKNFDPGMNDRCRKIIKLLGGKSDGKSWWEFGK